MKINKYCLLYHNFHNVGPLQVYTICECKILKNKLVSVRSISDKNYVGSIIKKSDFNKWLIYHAPTLEMIHQYIKNNPVILMEYTCAE